MEDEKKPKPSRKRKKKKTADAPIPPVEGAVEDLVEEVEPEVVDPDPQPPAAEHRARISGDELRHLLREQRKKARFEEKGY